MSYRELWGSSRGMQESKRMSHLKLRAPLDNCLAMRIFGLFRSVFALPSRMTGKSSTSEEVTRDAQVDGYHL